MERVGHWWNGSWGALTRRDVELFAGRGRWRVIARQGGAEGRERVWEYDSEQQARSWVRRCLDDQTGQWRQMQD